MTAEVDLIVVLQHLTNNDAGVRKQAESFYESMKADCDVFPFKLLTVIINEACDAYIRQLACVLLRRQLISTSTTTESVFVSMSAAKQQEFLNSMIIGMHNVIDRAVKSKLCDIAGELAGYVLEANQWPEIVSFALVFAQSADSQEREIGLSVLGSVSGSFLPSSPEYYNVLKIIGLSLIDTSNECKNITQAIGALYSMLLCTSLETQVDEFRVLMQNIFTGLQLLVQSGVEERMCAYAQVLVDIAEEKHSFFCSNLSETFAVITSWVGGDATRIPSSVRFVLVELLVTVCVTNPKKCRKLKGPSGEKNYFATTFLPMCLQFMSQVEVDDQWAERDTVEAIDEKSSVSDVGEAAMNRCCLALGVTTTYAVISSIIAPYVVATTWQHQFAAIQCIANYLEVSVHLKDKAQLRVHRMEVYTTLSHFIRSPVPKVRGAAYFAFSQLLMCHGSEMQSEQIGTMLHLIAEGVPAAVNPAPRVRRSAIIAIINLIDVANAKYTELNAEFILKLLAGSIREGPNMVRESCLSAVIGVAEALRDPKVWTENYEIVMPVIKELMVAESHDRESDSMWAHALECCAIVGEVAGKEKFYTDAVHLMSLLGGMQAETGEEKAEMFVMKAWVRIARCMGTEFLPYVPGIMKQLFACMSMNVVVPDDQYDIEKVDERSDIEMIETQTGWVAVRHAAVEELATASQLLILLAEKLQEHFYPYVEQSLQLLSKLIDSPHEDIRSFATVALPEMVRATGKATALTALQQLAQLGDSATVEQQTAIQRNGRIAVEELAGYCIGLLVTSAQSESSLVLVMTALQSMAVVIKRGATDWFTSVANTAAAVDSSSSSSPVYAPFLNTAQLTAVATCTKIIVQDSLQRRAVIFAESRVSGGVDGEEEDNMDKEQFLQESGELHYNISDLLCAVFRTHSTAFFSPLMEVWHDAVTTMCRSYCLPEDQQFAGSIVCDVIEYGLSSSTASQYIEAILPLLLDVTSNTTEAGPRRNTAYALGMICERYPSEFLNPHTQPMQALAALRSCIARGEEEGEMRGCATDNAVSAVGIILEQVDLCGAQILAGVGLESQVLWGQWLAYLPLKDDEDEGVKVLKQLVRLVNRRHGSLLSQQNHMARTVAILLEIVHDPVALGAQSVAQLCADTVCDLFGGPNQLSGDALVVLRKTLSPELNNTLSRIAQSYSARSGGAAAAGAADGVAVAGSVAVPIQDVLLRR